MTKEKNNQITLSDEIIMTKIFVIRNQKVMIDRDLAELYGVETRVLKQTVKRNLNRFPEVMEELSLCKINYRILHIITQIHSCCLLKTLHNNP